MPMPATAWLAAAGVEVAGGTAPAEALPTALVMAEPAAPVALVNAEPAAPVALVNAEPAASVAFVTAPPTALVSESMAELSESLPAWPATARQSSVVVL